MSCGYSKEHLKLMFRLMDLKIRSLDKSALTEFFFLNQKNRLNIVNIFLSIYFNICFGCSKESLIEMVLLITQNMFKLMDK